MRHNDQMIDSVQAKADGVKILAISYSKRKPHALTYDESHRGLKYHA
jgi:hypothetical protein